LTQRRWLIELEPAENAPRAFAFPAAADDAYAMTYQRYADADILDAEATTPLRWPVLRTARPWFWPAIVTGLVILAAAVGLFAFARRRQGQPHAASAYRVPEVLTPFTVVAFLRRMLNDPHLSLKAAERQDLRETVERLEQRFFARSDSSEPQELEPILSRWLPRTAETNGAV
jgi:hypothetical protein